MELIEVLVGFIGGVMLPFIVGFAALATGVSANKPDAATTAGGNGKHIL